MSGYVLKAAAGCVQLVMDWERGYLAPNEKVLRDLGWTVRPMAGAAPDLAVCEQGHDATRSWACVSGGSPGQVHLVFNRVRTSDDRVLCRAILVRIARGAGPQRGTQDDLDGSERAAR